MFGPNAASLYESAALELGSESKAVIVETSDLCLLIGQLSVAKRLGVD